MEQRLLAALREGNTRRTAVALAGIGQTTFYRWLAEFEEFRDAIEKAEGEAEEARVQQIARAASEGSWQAAAWWLERRSNAEWGRKDKVALDLGRMTNAELIQFITDDAGTDGARAADGACDPEAAG